MQNASRAIRWDVDIKGGRNDDYFREWPAAEIIPTRGLKIDRNNEVHVFKQGTVSVETMADYQKTKANAEKTVAEANQREQAALRSSSLAAVENHAISLPNISGLSLENAQKSLAMAQDMIQKKEDAGLSVYSHYGDQKISNLNAYTTALKD
jgi:hypothetical protein